MLNTGDFYIFFMVPQKISAILGNLCMLACSVVFDLCGPRDCSLPDSSEFSRQEYWNGVLFPTSEDLPDSGIEPASLASPALAGDSWQILYH